ncbi:MAG: helix-turn-helix domain-containing protein [Pseudomonadota bacterium]
MTVRAEASGLTNIMQQDGYTLATSSRLLEHMPLPREPRDFRDKAPALPRVLSTLPYDPPEQFEVWRSRMSTLSAVGLPEGASAAHGFEVEFMTCNMDDIVLSSGHFAAQTFARAAKSSADARLDHWLLFRLRSGEAWFETDERRIHAAPGGTFLISLDQDFHGRITDCEGMLLILPRAAFLPVAEGLDNLCNIVLSGNLIELLADFLSSLEARVVRMRADELKQAGRAAADMIAACMQPSPGLSALARGSIDSVLFERARLYIQNHLGEFDLTPERVAQQLRTSRSNLYRAFEHVGGVARYIQLKRLRAAHAELAERADKQVQQVAYRYGYKLASDFARAFRREFGYSPREARERRRQ